MKTLHTPRSYVIRSSAQAVPLWQAIGETVEQWRGIARAIGRGLSA